MQDLPSPLSQSFDLTQPPAPNSGTPLKLGGTNPAGERIGFTCDYMTWNEQPCIPVMGEFHFSRYARAYWQDALFKIKAGGVGIVATYVFWNHIEEVEGTFDWSGNNDLRHFITLCAECGVQSVVRIGPFAHGECRNGGMPDWLYGRPFAVRSSDPRYLAYVQRLYDAIAVQLDGLLFKQGGPVIGIQIENEYMHAGAPWETTYRPGTEYVPAGNEGADYMLLLKRMAQQAGLDVPLYTCTGWLRSPVPEGEMLPMQGGYFFTPWVPDPDFQQPPTREYLFRDRRQHPVINGAPTYDPMRVPYACCEIGGGTQDTYAQRNPVLPEAVEGLALMNLAGGANVIGYYMYHGGTNPVGRHGFMNEYTVPRRSYDFQAPLREFGQVAPAYGALRLLHTFLSDFGDVLAPMPVVLPPNAGEIEPENTDMVRCAVRAADGAGFLFLNSYQDHVEMRDLDGLRFALNTNVGTVHIPHTGTLTLQKQVSAILPFGLVLSGVRLRSATVQLLARIEEENSTTYFFFALRGMSSEYVLETDSFRALTVEQGEAAASEGVTIIRVEAGLGAVVTLENAVGDTVRFVTLTRQQAEQASKQALWGMERLLISEAVVVAVDDACRLYNRQPEFDLLVYPALDVSGDGQVLETHSEGLFTRCQLALPGQTPQVTVEQPAPDRAVVTLPPNLLDGVENVYLRVDYAGDIGSCFANGKLVSDNFYNGTCWEIGLKQVLEEEKTHELFFLITPKRATPRQAAQSSAMAFIPGRSEVGQAVIHSIEAVVEYRVSLAAVADVG